LNNKKFGYILPIFEKPPMDGFAGNFAQRIISRT